MAAGNFLRVSTDQGRCEAGLEAQCEAISGYLNSGHGSWKLVADTLWSRAVPKALKLPTLTKMIAYFELRK
jgi:hypothetical protein